MFGFRFRCGRSKIYSTKRFERGGTVFANEIRKRRIQGLSVPLWKWHLDEVFVRINGEQHYLWQAVYHEDEALESFITKQ
jgi:putative transposase